MNCSRSIIELVLMLNIFNRYSLYFCFLMYYFPMRTEVFISKELRYYCLRVIDVY